MTDEAYLLPKVSFDADIPGFFWRIISESIHNILPYWRWFVGCNEPLGPDQTNTDVWSIATNPKPFKELVGCCTPLAVTFEAPVSIIYVMGKLI